MSKNMAQNNTFVFGKSNSKITFRDLNNKYLLIEIPSGFEEINGFSSKNANRLFCYGYIDPDFGISFELLSFAVKKGSEVTIIGGSNSERYFFRLSFLLGCEGEILDWDTTSPEKIKPFFQKTFIIDTGYAPSEDVEKMRNIVQLDNFRHPEYPDVIEVMLSKQNCRPHKIKVNCTAIKENGLYGTVIGNSLHEFNLKAGDEINFGLVKLDGDVACISIIK